MSNAFKLSGALMVGSFSSAPSGAENGWIYYDTTSGTFQMYQGGSFRDIDVAQLENAIIKDGSVTYTANQPMGGFKLTGLGAGSTAGDSVRYEQAILTSGANAFTAAQSMGGFKLTNLADPTAAQDAATKNYVDSLSAGLDPKASVRAATTAALPSVTYNNGSGGVGATLTATANGALAAQDGITLIVGNRLLVKDQANAVHNGIYTVTQVGDGSNPFILTRATDQDGSPSGEVSGGNYTFVEAGTVNSGFGFVVVWDGNITVGTNDINWSPISSSSGANTSLSNLTTTSINENLLPSAPDTRNIGASGNAWDQIFAGLARYSSSTGYIDLTTDSYYDVGDVLSTDFANRQLIDGSNQTSIDWEQRFLDDAGSTVSVEYGNRLLRDSSTDTSIDWENRELKDSSNVVSMLYNSRDLVDPNGNSAVNYQTVGVVKLVSDGTNRRALEFQNATGVNNVKLRAPTSLTDYIITLPVDAGLNGQVLNTDGSANTSWTSQLTDNTGSLAIDFHARTLKSGATTKLDWSGTDVSLNTRKLTNVSDPTVAQDAATKAYVDGVSAGLDPKMSVRAATTAALPSVTYNNGSGGVGATLTATANGALPAQDGITLIVGNRLLVKNQASALQNGIYTVTQVGDGSNPFILTRATDQDGSPSNEVSGGNFTFVEQGTVQAGYGYVVVFDGNIVVGTDAVNWTQFSGGSAAITALTGDVTATGPGSVTATIANDAVTFAKMQNITSDRLLGRDTAGSGDTEEISLNSTLEFTGSGSIQRAALTGDVTASAGSNTTTIATDAVTSSKISIAYGGTLTATDLDPNDALQIKDSTSTKRDIAAIVDATALNGFFQTYTTNSLFVTPGQAGEAAQFTSSATFHSSVPGGGSDVSSGDGIYGSGAALYVSNPATTTGNVFMTSGYIFNSTTGVTTGALQIETGSNRNALGTANANGTSGNMVLKTGDTTGISGNLLLQTGDNNGANATDTGNITLQTGLASGTRGTINLVDGSEGTAGHVWTSTGTNGEGNWQAVSSGITQLTGDVTAGPGSGSQVATIANDAVTFAKMQNIATDRLMGRDAAGTGDATEISLNATLEFTGSNSIQRAALTGDVTASAGSNATTIANDAVTTAKIAANAVTDTKIRLANNAYLRGRNAANSADINMWKVTSTDLLQFGANIIGGTGTSVGVQNNAIDTVYVNQINDDDGSTFANIPVRALYDASSNIAIKFTAAQRELYDAAELLSLDFENRNVLDNLGTQSIDWQNRYLVHSGGQVSVDWETKVLERAGSITTLNWDDRSLWNSANNKSLDWETSSLNDTSGTQAVDGVNRRLKNGATTKLDWATDVTMTPTSLVKRGKSATPTSLVEEEYIHSTALAGSQTNTVIAALTFAFATYDAIEITYKIKQTTSNYMRIGTIRVATDGTNITLNDAYTDTTDLGISFSAAINGSNVEIRYTSGTNGGTMRMDVKRFLT